MYCLKADFGIIAIQQQGCTQRRHHERSILETCGGLLPIVGLVGTAASIRRSTPAKWKRNRPMSSQALPSGSSSTTWVGSDMTISHTSATILPVPAQDIQIIWIA